MTGRPPYSLETLSAQVMGSNEPATGGIAPGIYPAVTYQRQLDADGYREGLLYARDENPAFHQAERLLAALEGGAGALLVSSDMAAYSALLLMMPAGSHVLAPKTAFVTFGRWLRDLAPRWGYSAAFYTNDDLADLERQLQAKTPYAVWIETPGNPLWPVTDIAAVAALCRHYGCKLIVDNTVPSPVLTKPLELGADYSMHSCTKYLNGHSDVVMGAIVTKEQNDEWALLRRLRKDIGAVCSPFDSWLLMRGMQTLFLRVRQSSATALQLAQWLAQHPSIEAVHYPGLPDDPGHAVAQRQMSGGFGGMLSARVRGTRQDALNVCRRVKLFKVATSIGGTTSLIEHRVSIEGEDSGLPDTLLRLSIGIETAEDLQADLQQALG